MALTEICSEYHAGVKSLHSWKYTKNTFTWQNIRNYNNLLKSSERCGKNCIQDANILRTPAP